MDAKRQPDVPSRSLWLGRGRVGTVQKTIDRWLWLDPFCHQETTVSKSKQAISHYKKAVGDPAGVTELMVFFCEQAAGYCQDIGYQGEGFFGAPVRMFEQALKSANTLPANGRDSLIARLNRVREISHGFGYGSGDDMDFLAKYAEHSGWKCEKATGPLDHKETTWIGSPLDGKLPR